MEDFCGAVRNRAVARAHGAIYGMLPPPHGAHTQRTGWVFPDHPVVMKIDLISSVCRVFARHC